MQKIHEKSSCCGAAVRRFGGKRRQCVKCRKTWSIHPRRRGRKLKRGSCIRVIRYLTNARISSYARAALSHTAADRFEADLRRSRDLFLRTSAWRTLPNEPPLIAVADAFVKCIRGRWYTLYLILIRRSVETHAVIAPLLLLPGTETHAGWQDAFGRLPPPVKTAIRVLVCDGHKGLIDRAKAHRWLIQRCHFHLLAAVQGRRSRWGRSRHRKEGERAHRLAKAVLETPDESALTEHLRTVEDLALSTSSPQLRTILLGLRSAFEDYRTYLVHPQLHLPTTTNAAESFFSSVENLCHRTRGFCSVHSFMRWVTALAKNKQVIACRERNQQN